MNSWLCSYTSRVVIVNYLMHTSIQITPWSINSPLERWLMDKSSFIFLKFITFFFVFLRTFYSSLYHRISVSQLTHFCPLVDAFGNCVILKSDPKNSVVKLFLCHVKHFFQNGLKFYTTAKNEVIKKLKLF